MKDEIRIIGIDDMSFDRHASVSTKVIGIVFRGGSFLDGVLSTDAMIDGDDATANIAEMITKSKFKSQLQCIMLDGIAVAGFNVIDIERLYKKTGLPVIVVVRKMPDIENIKQILSRLDMDKKIGLIEKAGIPKEHKRIFFQCSGITEEKAHMLLDIASTRSYIPEPIRVAHLMGQGLFYGESRGRA